MKNWCKLSPKNVGMYNQSKKYQDPMHLKEYETSGEDVKHIPAVIGMYW